MSKVVVNEIYKSNDTIQRNILLKKYLCKIIKRNFTEENTLPKNGGN
jgi:hypothetical protein